MATKVSRATALNPIDTFAQHIALKGQAETIKKRADELKNRLKDKFFTFKGVYENENGSKFYDFPETLTVDKVDYKGMEMRRSTSTTFDEDQAEALLKKKGLLADAQITVTVLSQDKIAVLQQEGKISEAELDSMFSESEPSYAFWPVKGKVS